MKPTPLRSHEVSSQVFRLGRGFDVPLDNGQFEVHAENRSSPTGQRESWWQPTRAGSIVRSLDRRGHEVVAEADRRTVDLDRGIWFVEGPSEAWTGRIRSRSWGTCMVVRQISAFESIRPPRDAVELFRLGDQGLQVDATKSLLRVDERGPDHIDRR